MRRLILIGVALNLCLMGCQPQNDELEQQQIDEAKVLAGEQLFFDQNLSTPAGQSCANCHRESEAFADVSSPISSSEGIIIGRFGSRNTPSISYAEFSPPFHFDEIEGLYIGGQFLDGRAVDLSEQATGPLLNPLEMNNSSQLEVVNKVRNSSYANLLVRAFGVDQFNDDEQLFLNIGNAIAAFERSERFNPQKFTSKFDEFLLGNTQLSAQEARGMALFIAEDKGNCAACHTIEGSDGLPPLFTDFSYDNLGTPVNQNNPFYFQDFEFNPDGASFVDLGLGGVLNERQEENLGKFKVPTLRNIAITAPYMHNGVFSTLEEVVSFYNTRDIDPNWGAPEEARNVNTDELGDLGLSLQEEVDIVAFLKTLTDKQF